MENAFFLKIPVLLKSDTEIVLVMKNKFVIPRLLKSVTEIVLKLKHDLWADTMLLCERFRPERYTYSQATFFCCLQQWLL